MDMNDVYLPELDDLKSYDLPFEGTHDIESQRLNLEVDFKSADSDLDSEPDEDNTKFMVNIG